jgi:hypothetical protein
MRSALLSLLLIVSAPLAAIAADPPIVFQVQPVGQLLNEVRTVARMIGGEKSVMDFNNSIKESLGAKGFEGLDLERPIVGYVVLQPKLDESVGVIQVPVTGEKEFIGLLERIMKEKGDQPKSLGNGLYEFPSANDDVKVLMRITGQYANIAIGKKPKEALSENALVPANKLAVPGDRSLASAKVYFDRLPKEIRAQLSNGLKQIKEQLNNAPLPPDIGDTAKKALDELIKLGNRYADLLQDAQSATARVILDANTGEAALEIGLTGNPGSALAASIASRQPSTNKFAGLITPDTALGLKLQLPLFAKEIENAAVIGLEAGQKKLAEEAPPQYKTLIDETFKGLIRTVKTGEFDVAVALRGPDKGGFYSVVGAIAFEDPSAVEKELKKLYKTELPPMFQAMVALDVAKVGNTNIHQVKLEGLPIPGEVQKLLGDNPTIAFAFAPQGVFFAFGPDAIAQLKTALMAKKGPSPAFEISLNPSRMRKIYEAAGQPIPEGLGNQDSLFSAFAVSISGGKELQLRLSTNLKGLEGAGQFGFPSAKSVEKK